MSKLGFEKFINKKSAGKIKEEHRQEKRKSKAALREAGEEYRRQKLEKQRRGNNYQKEDERFRGGKSYKERAADKRQGEGARQDRYDNPRPERGADGRFRKSGASEGPRGASYRGKDGDYRADSRSSRGEGYQGKGGNRQGSKRDFNKKGADSYQQDRYKTEDSKETKGRFSEKKTGDEDLMALNKFIAHSGVCGRREAAELVKLGQVQVNGDIVFEPATKVSEKDVVKLKGKKLTLEVKHYYFLLNKPKDHITTTKDEKGRRTVLDLFKDLDIKHLYPVGRLDRNTTGVLLITNDGELAQQLTHPSFEVKKIYEATLDRPLAKKDLDAIASGITLEDGDIQADQVGYPDAKNKAVVGIEIHSGKNRIVRRIFEHLGYEVKKLDRVMFAGLTKKNVERGKWRYLAEKEIRILKYMNAGGTKKSKKLSADELDANVQTVEGEQSTAPAKATKRARKPIPSKDERHAAKNATIKRGASSESVKKGPVTSRTTRKEKH